jgi:hypothetical protein
MKRAIAILLLLMITACATVALSPEGGRVRMVQNAKDVDGCKLLGVVDASTQRGTGENFQNDLRNKAAVIGADTILMGGNRLTGPIGTSASAYRCAK